MVQPSSHPQKGPWPKQCAGCEEPVAYHSPRRLCEVCGMWLHADCRIGGAVCGACIPQRPEALRAFADELVLVGPHPGPHPVRDATLMVLWSLFAGTQDPDAIAEVYSMDPAFCRRVSERLLDQGIWKDGKLVMDLGGEEEPDPSVWEFGVTLAGLCGAGIVMVHHETRS